MKNKFFIIWVEGLTAKTGEKVKCFTETGVEYTTKMKETARFKYKDIDIVRNELTKRGINNPTFVSVNYAPKFKVFDLSGNINGALYLLEKMATYDNSVRAAEALEKGIITKDEASEIHKHTLLRIKIIENKFGSLK
jgi:hypothetical protein